MTARWLKLSLLSLMMLGPTLAVAQDGPRRERRHRGEGRKAKQRNRHHRQQVAPMPPELFDAFLARIRASPFTSDRVALITQASMHNHFLVHQLRSVIVELTFSSERVRTLELMAPRVLDPENAFLVTDALVFSSERDRAMELLAYR